MNEFRIIKNFKSFIFTCNNVLDNFPKKEKVLRDKLQNTCYDVLELLELANISDEKAELQKKIISKISMLDFYLEISFKRKYICEKQCKNMSDSLLNVTKMIYGWIKNGV